MKKYALVIGLGISGQGAVRLLLSRGYQVIGCDREIKKKEKLGIRLMADTDLLPKVPFQIAVLSPGIPLTHPLCVAARARGIEVIGEAELAFRYLSQRCIGITGTNGKTTLTLLLAHVLAISGKPARALGNVGTSLADYACHPQPDETLVVELSSFQLETLNTRALTCGVITSITPDHLDRYSSFKDYARTKARLSSLIEPGGKLFVSSEVMSQYRAFFSPQALVEEVPSVSCLQLTKKKGYWGKLDREKVFFVQAVANYIGINETELLEGLRTFSPLPHRLEDLGDIGGISFYNDSKATNSEAVLFAIRTLDRPVLLIAGGLDKKGDFSKWKKAFAGKVSHIMAIGKAASLIQSALGSAFDVTLCQTLDRAVAVAYDRAKKGDVILLSPGCASFDQFSNYEERGDRFKRLVSSLRSRI
ncbi:MAG: UDP-N-acetylmuramoyl-L-alanine--D-glutamate ligase [Chlamydiota bacterium]